MPSRYQRPAPKPPSRDDLYYYLRHAKPTVHERQAEPKATEKRRVESIAALQSLARSDLANADEWHNMEEGRPHELGSYLGAITPELLQFLKTNGLRVLLAEDPYEELERFLGKGPPRRKKQRNGKGRPAEDNERRNILIATDVSERVDSGMTVDEACEAVDKQAPVGFEMIKKIYQARDRDAVAAELCLRNSKQNTAG